MNPMAEPADRSRYSETQLREIIARAAAPEPLYSSDEIRDIGAELGIEASAIEAMRIRKWVDAVLLPLAQLAQFVGAIAVAAAAEGCSLSTGNNR
jgi:hypothetical protein